MSLKAILEHLKKDFTLKEKEVFYKIGDRFECKCGIYRINSLGNNRVALIIVKKYYGDEVGTVWTAEDYSVKDPSRITQKEFDRISQRDQNYPAWFTLIKEEEEEPEEEVFYKIGDRFKCKCGGIYQLSMIGNNRVSLVKVEKYDGDEVGIVWYTKTYSVNDPCRITQKEFERISDRDPSWFTPSWYTLIKEEEEDEISYKVGDRFNGVQGIYQLSHTGNNRIGLIVVEKVGELEIGWTWRSEGYKVNNIHHITQEEFYNVTGGHPEWFTLIKEEEPEEITGGFHYWGTLTREEEKEPEEEDVFYKVGDRFESYPASIFRLSSLGNNRVALVKVYGELGALKIGHIICVEDHSVNDNVHITEEEFSRIVGGNQNCFKLMKS